MNDKWVTNLTDYNPINLGGHWGKNQAGFSMSLSGRIWLTDNKHFPCHRDLVDGSGDDKTIYAGIYSWNKQTPELYVYCHLEQLINESEIQSGLRSLIGVHLIRKNTPVISNSNRNTLFVL